VGPAPPAEGDLGSVSNGRTTGSMMGMGESPEECSNHTIITVTDSLQRQITLVRTSIPKSLQ
jgi:hypothetical protein